MFAFLDYKLLGLEGKAVTAMYCLSTILPPALPVIVLCTRKALDNKSVMSSTTTLSMKFSESHIKNFETSTEMLFSLTFGGICLLNFCTGPLA